MAKNRSERRSLAGRLTRSGFTLPFDISPFIDRALKTSAPGVDPFDVAYSMVLKSKIFRRHYRGIFRPNGTLKMTPAAYEKYFDSARAAARSAGLTINRKQFGRFVVGQDQSADEFNFRINAATQIKANQDSLTAFNDILKTKGEKPLKTADQIFDFLNGKGSQRVYNLYEESSILGQARGAGQDISPEEARRLSRITPGVTSAEEAAEKFQHIQQDLELAREELIAFGVSEKQIRTQEFGGAGAGRIARERKRIVEQRRTALTNRPGQFQVDLTEGGRPIIRGPEETDEEGT